ncbi:unnamed protein product [Caenorhabditis nigoni]
MIQIFNFVFFILFIFEASGASINISSNLLNTSIPNQRGEVFHYLQNQLLGRYQLELLSNVLPGLGIDVRIDGDDSESFDRILNLPKASLEVIENLLKDTVIGGKFIGDTGSDTLNRLVQEAVSNGIPLTDMFEIRDGVVHLKV